MKKALSHYSLSLVAASLLGCAADSPATEAGQAGAAQAKADGAVGADGAASFDCPADQHCVTLEPGIYMLRNRGTRVQLTFAAADKLEFQLSTCELITTEGPMLLHTDTIVRDPGGDGIITVEEKFENARACQMVFVNATPGRSIAFPGGTLEKVRAADDACPALATCEDRELAPGRTTVVGRSDVADVRMGVSYIKTAEEVNVRATCTMMTSEGPLRYDAEPVVEGPNLLGHYQVQVRGRLAQKCELVIENATAMRAFAWGGSFE